MSRTGTPLHMLKLCVGVGSVEELERWIAFRLEQRRQAGDPAEQYHTTRQMPKQREAILAGGSLYWVIAGFIQCRQQVMDLRAVEGEDGIRRCRIVLEPRLVRVRPTPRRPFQGWRYLRHDEVPPDIADGTGAADMPLEMQKELAELGLL